MLTLLSLFILQIFTVDDSFKVELQFTQSVEDVEKNRDAIVRCIFHRLFKYNNKDSYCKCLINLT